MDIGNLRHRIVLQTESKTENDYGEPITTWVDGPARWAHVSHQKGDESFVAAQTDATRTIKVLMRFREGVTTTDRIKWRGDLFDIHDTDESLRHKGELWIMATAHDV